MVEPLLESRQRVAEGCLGKANRVASKHLTFQIGLLDEHSDE
jgi:hypothetical protein